MKYFPGFLQGNKPEDAIRIRLHQGSDVKSVKLDKCELSSLLQLTIEAPNLIVANHGSVKEKRGSSSYGRTQLEFISHGDLNIISHVNVKNLTLKALSSSEGNPVFFSNKLAN